VGPKPTYLLDGTFGALNLGSQLALDFAHVWFVVQQPAIVCRKIPVDIDQRFTLGKGPPLHLVPLACQRQMNSNRNARAFVQACRNVVEPGTWHDHVRAALDALVERLNRGVIDRVQRAAVVAAHQ
jgi:hypothetical protein